MTSLRHPHVRRRILEALEALADPAYQQRVWIEQRFPEGVFFDHLDYAVHVLFDDSDLLSDARKQVGLSIYEDEVHLFGELGARFGALIDELGDVADIAYLEHPEWMDVVVAARRAAAAVRERDRRDGTQPAGDESSGPA